MKIKKPVCFFSNCADKVSYISIKIIKKFANDDKQGNEADCITKTCEILLKKLSQTIQYIQKIIFYKNTK